MQAEYFRQWLRDEKSYPEQTISCRISNCKRVEQFYGDLDKIIANCSTEWLIEELSYSAQNERDNVIPKIPIDGNIKNGYATLKKAVKLYFRMYEI